MSGEKSVGAEIDIILKRIKELEQEVEKLRKAGVERAEKEKLLQELRELVSATREANVINIRIATTARGAIFRLKRGVWALMGQLKKQYQDRFDLETSKNNWAKMASLIIRKINEAGLTEYPTKIVMTYEVVEQDGKVIFKPKTARILTFEPAGHLLATFEEAEKEEVKEEVIEVKEEEGEEE
ncbi:MAG: hypothetical protein ACTSX9_06725 [Candidatus Njordarchaeales archaeon]